MTDTKNQKNKQGIALVIVLGFLSILTIMAVGFVIAMRTERLVSRSYQEAASARQLVDTALARALNEIESVVADNFYPDFSSYGSTNCLLSLGDGQGEINFQAIIDFLPGALTDEVTEAVQQARWTTLVDVQGNTNGRIAYVVANCSGFLSANTPMQTDRGSGLSVGEIVPLSGTGTDFSTDSVAEKFFNLVRADWGHLIDQRELAGAYCEIHSRSRYKKEMPDYLFAYSYAPENTPLALAQSEDGAYYHPLGSNVVLEAHGRINLNSPYFAVVAAGFKDSVTSGGTFSQLDAIKLANVFINNRPSGGYTNLLHALSIIPPSEFEIALGNDAVEIEEVIYLAQRLFTVRQQLFTIFMCAQSLSRGQPVGETRAIAVVWRDPKPDEQGEHEIKLLGFSYLDE